MDRNRFLENIKGKRIADVVFDATDNGEDPFKIVALTLEGGYTLLLKSNDENSILASFEFTEYEKEKEAFHAALEKAKPGGAIRFVHKYLSWDYINAQTLKKMKEIGAIGVGPVRDNDPYTCIRFDSKD